MSKCLKFQKFLLIFFLLYIVTTVNICIGSQLLEGILITQLNIEYSPLNKEISVNPQKVKIKLKNGKIIEGIAKYNPFTSRLEIKTPYGVAADVDGYTGIKISSIDLSNKKIKIWKRIAKGYIKMLKSELYLLENSLNQLPNNPRNCQSFLKIIKRIERLKVYVKFFPVDDIKLHINPKTKVYLVKTKK